MNALERPSPPEPEPDPARARLERWWEGRLRWHSRVQSMTGPQAGGWWYGRLLLVLLPAVAIAAGLPARAVFRGVGAALWIGSALAFFASRRFEAEKARYLRRRIELESREERKAIRAPAARSRERRA